MMPVKMSPAQRMSKTIAPYKSTKGLNKTPISRKNSSRGSEKSTTPTGAKKLYEIMLEK
jgi:hypothetical protein